MLVNCGLVALGGAVGCVVRYLVTAASLALFGHSFPVGTLLVNVVGCLLIGIVGRMTLGSSMAADGYRLVLAVGFLGGLTTFSSFSVETYSLFAAGRHWVACAYILLSNSIGLLGTGVGWSLASMFLAGGGRT